MWVGTNGYGVRKYTTDTEQFNHIGSGFSVRKIVELPNNQTYAVGWGEIKKFDANLKLITTEKTNYFLKIMNLLLEMIKRFGVSAKKKWPK